MRSGWTDEELAVILDVQPRKASQAYRPALIKLAKLMVMDSHKTILDLSEAMEEVKADIQAMSAEEWERRYRIQTGRIHRWEVGQALPGKTKR